MSKLSRRSFLFACSATALAAIVPAPVLAAPVIGSSVERAIAAALNSAAIRQKFTPKEAWDIATKLGVSLETAAPRATPWMKLIARASPIGRVLTIVGAVALAYDYVNDQWTAAPRETATKGTYDGNIEELCPIGQTCRYVDASTQETFFIIQTKEKTTSLSTWTYYLTYPVVKQVSLPATERPYVYKVYWKVGTPDLPRVMDPKPANPQEKKPVIAPGNLADYLKQFAEDPPDVVGLSEAVNDMLEKMESTSSGIRTGLRTIASDVAKAIAGVGTKLKDFLKDTPYDRPPNVTVDPQTGVPIPDPDTLPEPGTGTGPGTVPEPGTGTGSGSGGCAPGAADCPAKVDWGAPPTGEPLTEPSPFSWVPTPWNAPDLPGSCSGVPYDFSSVLRGVAGSIDPCPALNQARPVVRPVAVTGWTVYAISQFLDL